MKYLQKLDLADGVKLIGKRKHNCADCARELVSYLTVEDDTVVIWTGAVLCLACWEKRVEKEIESHAKMQERYLNMRRELRAELAEGRAMRAAFRKKQAGTAQ